MSLLDLSRQDPLQLFLLLVDVALVAFLIYRVLVLIRGTRAVQMLVGLLMLLTLHWLSSEGVLHLRTTHWLLSTFLASLLVIVVVVFQDDIRRALTEVGRNPFSHAQAEGETAFYEEVVQAAGRLAERGFGALMVLARDADLRPYGADGIPLDAAANQNLLYAIFIPKDENPLHDGAALIQNGRVASAACFLPLTTNPEVDRTLGTRHRAAIGISEETDAVVVVISEERGSIGMAVHGQLERDLDTNQLRARLQAWFRRPPDSPVVRWVRQRRRRFDSATTEIIIGAPDNANKPPAVDP